ncbi:hypothetical protein JHL17_34085 [Azospirillum sp. YIM B02556]|uniref:Uncharacterized protein n=1 Tax=Azospirillum endophyticum TaxID=2800326 RepID=A0ABS1FG77_9PROT|nr:hypothetical protein [Azospirillum endophyticum]MBK1842437.1 hypothetical protein [Azospirillum endophyticum]
MLNRIIPTISDDLTLRIGNRKAQLTARDGIRLAEDLTRLSFRRLLVEEAESLRGRTADQSKSAGRGRRGS